MLFIIIIILLIIDVIIYVFIGDASLKCTNLFFTKFLHCNITNIIYYETP